MIRVENIDNAILYSYDTPVFCQRGGLCWRRVDRVKAAAAAGAAAPSHFALLLLLLLAARLWRDM